MDSDLSQLNLLSVSQARDLLQAVLDEALPVLLIEGEVSGLNVNKNVFVFFDIKDESSTLRCFMMASALTQPIEDGMTLRLVARPRITARGQLSLTVEAYELVGEGSLKRAFDILQAKLKSEGLFATERKRSLPEVPRRIGLVASGESAAYTDFIKVLGERWGGIEVIHADTQVQGAKAVSELVEAIAQLNQLESPPDIIVVTRGGGSLEDLAAFNDEKVVRAVAASRVPTMVAVGHERDVSLAELAADKRASTPSNAAELLVPSKQQVTRSLQALHRSLAGSLYRHLQIEMKAIDATKQRAHQALKENLTIVSDRLQSTKTLLKALDPSLPMKRGFVLAMSQTNQMLTSVKQLKKGDPVTLRFVDGQAQTKVTEL